ncbi:MAG: GNAT family N-acetyltransferase [Gammaproteobacteria bacterium]|jgi:GNAT superfamily N-acetyltransferase|nr:GNAT family N-acetyltransferase [Gammaproteobacteria bacterium]
MSNSTRITIAESEAEIRACFPVIRQLRPHLDEEGFLARVRAQQPENYHLASRSDGAQVVAVAGYRFVHNLAWGHHMYVDDLVTDAGARSRGHGIALLEWLVERAKQAGCEGFRLDSGVQRFDAHRFYMRAGLYISAYDFCLPALDALQTGGGEGR